MVRVGMTPAALISFYVLLLLLYVQTRPALVADDAVPAPRSIEPPWANHSRPVRLRQLLSRNLSATVEHWAESRMAAKQPLRLVVSGLTSAGTEWLAAVLQIILEEALAAHGKPPVHLVSDACREKKYCILNADRFTPDALAAADAVFTAHRDVRDVLLYMHAVGAVEKAGAARGAKLASALGKLEREFGVYRAGARTPTATCGTRTWWAWAPHARSGAHRRARAAAQRRPARRGAQGGPVDAHDAAGAAAAAAGGGARGLVCAARAARRERGRAPPRAGRAAAEGGRCGRRGCRPTCAT